MKTWMKVFLMTTAMLLILTACENTDTVEPADATTATTTQASSDETVPTTAPQGVPDVNGDNMEVVDNEDGTFTRITYDEQGNVIRSELIDGDETVLEETLIDREFDENGKLLRETMITDANKVSESVYAYSTEAEGETYLAQETWFYTDGTKEVTVFAEVGMNYKTILYDADGQAQSAEEYLYDDDGSMTTVYYEGEDQILKKEISKTDESGKDVVTTLDADDNIITKQVYEYDETGMVVTVYDEDGNELSCERVDFEGEDLAG